MALPSVLLHDHLDGGLRPGTVIELAGEHGYDDLPSTDEARLAQWFDQSGSGGLEPYLRSFVHTIAVMQYPEAVERVAYEAGIDLHRDGVVYAEVRFSPPLHSASGHMDDRRVIEAAAAGLSAAARETGLVWGLIVGSLRQLRASYSLARLSSSSRHLGVVAFDLAGPEAGNPPDRHLAACRLVRRQGLNLTLHAGEGAGGMGVAHIASSVDLCGAQRIGHGIEIIDDCLVRDGEIAEVGPVARRVRSLRVPLEICPASNLATKRLAPEEHPLGALYRAGFTVTLNTDNRLMSATSMSSELAFAEKHHDFGIDDLARVTWNGLNAAFCSWETKAALWEDVIAPAYSKAGADVDDTWR